MAAHMPIGKDINNVIKININVAINEPLIPPPSVDRDRLVILIALSNFFATSLASSLLTIVS